MATLAANVLPLAELFRQYNHCGGGMQPLIKCELYQGRSWRGPEEFSNDDFVGYNIHARPLAEQFKSLAGTAGTADEPLVESLPT
jgi:hypothetical protein